MHQQVFVCTFRIFKGIKHEMGMYCRDTLCMFLFYFVLAYTLKALGHTRRLSQWQLKSSSVYLQKYNQNKEDNCSDQCRCTWADSSQNNLILPDQHTYNTISTSTHLPKNKNLKDFNNTKEFQRVVVPGNIPVEISRPD